METQKGTVMSSFLELTKFSFLYQQTSCYMEEDKEDEGEHEGKGEHKRRRRRRNNGEMYIQTCRYLNPSTSYPIN